MSSIPDPMPRYINSINRELTGLFPPTDRDLKVHIAAMEAFLNNEDPQNSKVKDLLSLKTRIIEQASPENKGKIENAFTDQITAKIKRYEVIANQTQTTEETQTELNKTINPEKASSLPEDSPLEQIKKALQQDFPPSDLAVLEAYTLLKFAKPLYEEKIRSLQSNQAAEEAVQEAREQLNDFLKKDPSISALTSSLSGSIIRCPAYLIGDEQPQERFEKDEIEEYILKRHTHPYELDLSGSKRAVSMDEIRIDTDLENRRKKAFSQIYHSILEGSDLSFNDMPASLIHAVKNLVINNDKWSPLLPQYKNHRLQQITDMISFGNTLDEKLITAALIALASPGDEYLSPQNPEQSMEEAGIKLLNRLEQDPVLFHCTCPITYNLLRDPICINNMSYYENTAFNKCNNPNSLDFSTGQPISSKEPATEMKNFITNRIKEICSSLILTQTMQSTIWKAKIDALEIPATYCSNTLNLLSTGIDSSILAIGIERVIQDPERESIIQSAERKSIIMNRGIETVIRTIEYLEKHNLDFSGKCCPLKKILTMPGSTLKIDLLSLDKELQNDREVVLAVVKQNGKALEFVNEKFKKDRDVVLAAVRRNGLALQFASQELRNDREIVLAAVRQNGLALQFASQELRNDREIVLAAVRQDGIALQFASQELRNNREIVLVTVTQYGLALQFASQELRNDREIVLAAARQKGLALQFPSQELRNDREIVLAAARQKGLVLQFASEALRNNPEVVLAAVTQDGLAIHFAGEPFKNNRDFILAAVTQKGEVLQFVNEEFKNDREIVLVAVTQDGWALQFASEALRNDPAVVLAAVTQNGSALQFASEALRNDPAVVLAAVTQNGKALQFAGEALRNNREVILAAVTQDGWTLRLASKKLQNDPAVVLAAVTQYGSALQFASEALQNDPAVVLAAVTQYGSALEFAGEEPRNNREVILAAVTKNGWTLQSASKKLQNDPAVVLAAVTQYGSALAFVTKEFKNDREVVLAAITQDGKALQVASEELKRDKAFCLEALKTNKHIYLELSPDMQRDLNIIQAYFEPAVA